MTCAEQLVFEWKSRKSGLARWLTLTEVSSHATEDSIWVIINHIVFDITPVVKEYRGILVNPDLVPGLARVEEFTKAFRQFAGTDISHWFTAPEQDTSVDVLQYIEPVTNTKTSYLPHGLFPGVLHDGGNFREWWNQWDLVVGLLTFQSREIKITNMLAGVSNIIEVCKEETCEEILRRYLPLNNHARSYTWKYNLVPIDMNKTLEDNGIEDEREEFIALDMYNENYIPCLQLFYNDDLTIA